MRPIVVADGPGTPTIDPLRTAADLGVSGVPLFLGWTVDDRPWIDELPLRSALTYLPTYGLRAAVARGAVEYMPIRLASIPAFLHHVRPSLAIVSAIPRGAGFAFTQNVGYADTAARLADQVVIQVIEDGIDVGAPLVEGNIVKVVEGGMPAPPQPVATLGSLEAGIAAVAASLVPAGATVQYGVGGIPDAVVRAITQPVSVISGLISPTVAGLHDRGLLVGAAIASYAWGDESLIALAREGRFRPVGLEALHAGDRFAAAPQLVAVNAALQVGLDGAVNIERAGGRLVAGIGGHADYSAAATQSLGGFSMVALPSTHRDRSTIVATPEVVSTSRADIHVVVTEHGIADLRGLTEDARRAAIVAVADPAHRAALEATGA